MITTELQCNYVLSGGFVTHSAGNAGVSEEEKQGQKLVSG